MTSDVIHATVAIVAVLAAAVLAATSRLPSDVVGSVFVGAIGFAAGRSGTTGRP